MNPHTRPDAPAGLDPGIAITTLLLVGLGVVMSYSATATLSLDSAIPPLFSDHLVGLGEHVRLVSLFRQEVLELEIGGLVAIHDEDAEPLLRRHRNPPFFRVKPTAEAPDSERDSVFRAFPPDLFGIPGAFHEP